jgi:formiminotetrahydrofolate cyclodeaminase
MSGSYATLSVAELLEALASDEPTPGGGAGAAIAVALAAGLVAMAARRSLTQIPQATAVADRADELRRLALSLAAEDAESYEAVLESREGRAQALSAAANPPLAVTEAASEIASLAAHLARSGNPNLRGDALTAAFLADAGARAAAELVEINLRAAGVSDERSRRAAAARGDAADAIRSAHADDPRP